MGILEKMRLDGKVSFVTGGARGIGKAIAQALAEAGSDLAPTTNCSTACWSPGKR